MKDNAMRIRYLFVFIFLLFGGIATQQVHADDVLPRRVRWRAGGAGGDGWCGRVGPLQADGNAAQPLVPSVSRLSLLQ